MTRAAPSAAVVAVSLRAGERGFALTTALFVLLLLSIGLSLVAASLTLHLRLSRDEAQSLRRTALADAALAEALAGIAYDAGYPGAPDHAFGEGTIGSEVDALGGGRYLVRVHGAYAGRIRAARAEVLRSPSGEVRVVRWQPGS